MRCTVCSVMLLGIPRVQIQENNEAASIGYWNVYVLSPSGYLLLISFPASDKVACSVLEKVNVISVSILLN